MKAPTSVLSRSSTVVLCSPLSQMLSRVAPLVRGARELKWYCGLPWFFQELDLRLACLVGKVEHEQSRVVGLGSLNANNACWAKRDTTTVLRADVVTLGDIALVALGWARAVQEGAQDPDAVDARDGSTKGDLLGSISAVLVRVSCETGLGVRCRCHERRDQKDVLEVHCVCDR